MNVKENDMEETAVIVANGDINDYHFYKKYLESASFIICADGGARHLKKMRVLPNVLLGDFDSIDKADLDFYRQSGVVVLEYPAEKDVTDTELAIEYAAQKGFGRVVILGALGSRIDHSLSNILSLKKMLEIDIKGVIIDEHNEILLIRDGIHMTREEGASITLLPLSDKVEGVCTKGLKYPLDNAVIYMGSSWGVSNEFIDETAEVSIEKGLLLVIKSKDSSQLKQS